MTNKKVKIKLKGHETFVPKEGWLSKGMSAVNMNPFAFSENYGADILGVGSNMAKSIRHWMKACKISVENSKEGVKLSDTAQIIFENDPFLEDKFSKWVFHINLISNSEVATIWHIFFNFMELEEFTKEQSYERLKSELSKYLGSDEFPLKSVDEDNSVLLNMYAKVSLRDDDPEDMRISPFSELGLIKYDGKKYKKCIPGFDILDKLAVLYCINSMAKEDSVSIEALLTEKNSPGKVLHLNRVVLNEYLDQLYMAEYLTVNRTAGLDVVYLNKDITNIQIIQDYYRNR